MSSWTNTAKQTYEEQIGDIKEFDVAVALANPIKKHESFQCALGNPDVSSGTTEGVWAEYIIDVPQGGDFNVNIFYSSPESSRPLSLNVGGKDVGVVASQTVVEKKWVEEPVLATLQTGKNTIRLSAQGLWPIADSLVFVRDPYSQPPPVKYFEQVPPIRQQQPQSLVEVSDTKDSLVYVGSTPPRNPVSRPTSARGNASSPKKYPTEEVTVIRATTESELRSLFKRYDVDGSGFLDREEFKQEYIAMEAGFGLVVSDKEVNAVFSKYDKDKDGKLHFEEFALLMLHRTKV